MAASESTWQCPEPLPPRSEEAVVSTWDCDGPPVVSIICPTYNQRELLPDAINGFMAQITSFPFEVILQDDASADGTAALIRTYLTQYPRLMRARFHTENQFRHGNRNRALLAMARGRYIASCDGDDYWINPYKLQRQYELMEAHPEWSACGGMTFIGSDCIHVKELVRPSRHTDSYGPCDVIEHFFLHTSTRFVRADLWQQVGRIERPPFIRNGDQVQLVLLATVGSLGYLHEPLSFYRLHPGGRWTNQPASLCFYRQTRTDRFIDRLTQGRFHNSFLAQRRKTFIATLHHIRHLNPLSAFSQTVAMLVAGREPILLIDLFHFHRNHLRAALQTHRALILARLRGRIPARVFRYRRGGKSR
jgi:glycosyltransferase involved in cell wall biosynthesis